MPNIQAVNSKHHAATVALALPERFETRCARREREDVCKCWR